LASPSKIPANRLVQTVEPVFCSIATHAPFRHRTLEDLGRILVQDTGDGHSRISCEVVGDPAVPMTAKRGEVFKPLGLELAQRLEALTGTIPEAQAAPPPPSPPGARDIVESRPCKRFQLDENCQVPVFLRLPIIESAGEPTYR
jgi:hypothetical protein